MAAIGSDSVSTASDVPGEPATIASSVIEKTSGVLQSFRPINRIHNHLCAFHFYAYDMRRQLEAHHYCTHYNDDVHQCLIYDTPEKDARLIGVEYIVSEKVFLTLPDDEKKLWHSHKYEVKSGVLFMPGLPDTAERQVMKHLCKTYGKVFHFWQVDRGDTLPLGPPQLMMALTSDGQVGQELVDDVERRFGISVEEKRKQRGDLEGPELGIHPLANSWQSGRGMATELREASVHKDGTGRSVE